MSAQHIARGRGVRRNAGVGIFLLCAVLLAGPSLGQQATGGDAAKKEATVKKAAGRLPTYFAAVVSQKQRESIYKLQADYEAQLEKLQAQLEALIADRDREVDAVLSAEQLAEVTKKRDEAKKKREERVRSKSSEANPSEEKTSETNPTEG